MDYAAFHIVYVDKRVSNNLDGTYLKEPTHDLPAGKDVSLRKDQPPTYFQLVSSELEVVRDNINNLLTSFHGGTSISLSNRFDRLRAVLCIGRLAPENALG